MVIPVKLFLSERERVFERRRGTKKHFAISHVLGAHN